MSENLEKNGIFLNGKNQVIELFRYLDQDHKAILLKQLKIRNPALAKELSENCFSYDNLWSLDDDSLRKVLQTVSPVILGLALFLSEKRQQKRALSLLPRQNAERAYEIMLKDLSRNRKECQKAQDKILQNAIALSKRSIISFF